MFKQTLQARRKRRRLVSRILGFFGAQNLDYEIYPVLRTCWGHEDREGYGQ